MSPNISNIFNMFRSLLLMFIYIFDHETVFHNTTVNELTIYNFYNELEQNMSD